MTRVRIVKGTFANFEGEVVADEGEMLRVAVEIFGRRTEVELERAQTDAPPLPPIELPSLATVLDELDAWMRSSAPEVHAAQEHTAEEDLQLLAALGPGAHDLAELYRRFGGTTDWQGFFHGCELVPLRSAFGTREVMNGLEHDDTFYRWMPNEWWNPAWLPFLDNHSYDMYCVDLVGTMGGVAGQIVRWSKDDASRPILAPSLGAWLGAHLIGRERGDWIWDPHGGIRVAPGREHVEHRLLRRALPGYPKPTAARSRKEVEGAEPPPKPARAVESSGLDYRVVKQWWAPGSTTVHALAYVEDRELLAVGQYDWGEAPGGCSLVDPTSGEVVETVLGKAQGSALELIAVGSRLVIRRFHDFANEVLVYERGELHVAKRGLPTQMEAFIAVGDDAIAIAGKSIEVFELAAPHGPRHRLALSGEGCVLGLSADGATLAVGHPDQPLRWYDVATARQIGQTEETMTHPKRLVFGIDGDVWMAGNQGSQRFALATGELREHDAAYTPFVIALHRATRRIAFAGYGGRVVVLDARSGKELAHDDTHGCRVYGLAWNAAGDRLWSGDEGGQLVERAVGTSRTVE